MSQKEFLRTGCVVLVAFAAAPLISVAEEPTAEELAAAETTVVVSGIRRSNAAAIESKREAINIVDVVSANDARALPDQTIVETLRRVPGLSVLPAIDNEHPRDEASTPVIRGLGPSYNNVTIDGLSIASPGTPNGNLGSVTRGVRLDILPSSMISEIQVVKSFTADLDPNAVGGAIDLRTRSAFENDGQPFFTTEASFGHAANFGQPRDQDDLGKRLVATGSTTFGGEGQFGVVLSANYQSLGTDTQTHMTTDTVHYSFYDASGALQSGNNLGNGIAVPQQDKYWYVTDQRDRYGFTGKFEARLAETLDAFVTGGYYSFKDDMERNELLIDPRDRSRVFNQTPTSGSYPVGDIEVGFSNQVITTRTRVTQTGLSWRPTEEQVLSVRVSDSEATYDEPIRMIKYGTGIGRPAAGTRNGVTITPTTEYATSYDTSSPTNFSFPVSAAAYNNLANYSLLYWRPDFKREAEDKIRTGRVDYAFNQGKRADGLGFAVGASYTDDKPSYNVDRVEYAPNVTAGALGLVDALGRPGPSLGSLGLSQHTIDPVRATAVLNAQPSSAFNSTDQSGFNNQDDFTHQEKIAGAYGLVTYINDALSVQGGVHHDRTEQSTVGRIRRAGAFQDIETESDYDYFLPSAVLTYHATSRLDVRAAASRTIGRPPYDAYAARSSINFVTNADIGNPNATGVSVTIGNPDIKPRRSDNIDVSVDWRIPGSAAGLVSLAAFNKRIEDEIFTLSSVGFTDEQGVTYVNALVSRPANASKASIRGVELNGVMNSLGFISPWLHGLGASANVALLDGELDVPTPAGTRRIDRLVGQSDYTANATVFYTHEGFELRAAYNRQGKALRSIVSDVSWQDLYWAPRSQTDVSATYAFSPQLTVLGQVSNLTESDVTSLTGNGTRLLKDGYSVPRTYWLGVRYTPAF